MTRLPKRFSADRRAATVIEYALIVAILGLGVVVSMTGMRDQVNRLFNTVGNSYQIGG